MFLSVYTVISRVVVDKYKISPVLCNIIDGRRQYIHKFKLNLWPLVFTKCQVVTGYIFHNQISSLFVHKSIAWIWRCSFLGAWIQQEKDKSMQQLCSSLTITLSKTSASNSRIFIWKEHGSKGCQHSRVTFPQLCWQHTDKTELS